jgi:UDP-GlcNAc3NAcA epimerase
MKKVLTIVGARPQFVKAAVVSRAFRGSSDLEEVMLHTGQHFDESMSGIFFESLGIPEPKYNLGISNLSHGAMTGRMLEEIEKVLMAESPAAVLVYGDTNSTLAGALAARKLHLYLAHVEAGLRSFEMAMPEEVNRIITDRISDILYCPTDHAIRNLKSEGFSNFDVRMLNVGDVMYDAVLHFRDRIPGPITQLLPEKFAVCTVHRAENVDHPEKLRSIFEGLAEISKELEVVMTMHPRTRAAMCSSGIETQVRIIDPVGYLDMLDLVSKSSLVLTDSGGLQKEAFFLGKYCITLRDTTEWTELVEAEVNTLAGADRDKIVASYRGYLLARPDFSPRPYGAGNAGQLIVADLEAHIA